MKRAPGARTVGHNCSERVPHSKWCVVILYHEREQRKVQQVDHGLGDIKLSRSEGDLANLMPR